MELSDKDKRLIRALQRDARLSNQDLAEMAGYSTSACWRRVKALEEAGLITGYVAEVDPEKVGLGFGAVVQVTLARHERDHVDGFVKAVARRGEVLEIVATTGDADYHMRVLCADKAAYNAFLDDFLFRLPGVSQVRTSVILKDLKRTSVLPI